MSWLSAIKSAFAVPTRTNHQARPRLEALEDRLVMDARAVVVNLGGVNILSVQGTDNHDEIAINSVITRDGRALVTARVVDRLSGATVLSSSHDATSFSDILVDGRAGDDVLFNNTAFRSTLLGGEGNDTLVGGHNNDVLRGDNGHDVLVGMGGDDRLDGGRGNDTYRFLPAPGGLSLGHDIIEREADFQDTDALDFSQFNRSVRVDLQIATRQVVHAGLLELTIAPAAFPVIDPRISAAIENVFGSNQADTIFGNARDNALLGDAGNDALHGRDGNDFLFGGGDHDRLFGGDGFDQLFGGLGDDYLDGSLDSFRDQLFGGGGADKFATHRIEIPETNTTIIARPDQFVDFNSAEDQLVQQVFVQIGDVLWEAEVLAFLRWQQQSRNLTPISLR